MKWTKPGRSSGADAAPAAPRNRGAKVLRFPLVRLLLSVMVVSLALNGTRLLLRSAGLAPEDAARHRTAALLLGTLATIAVVHVAYLLYVHHVEGRAATEFAASGAVRELAAGTLGGAAIFSLVILVLVAGGWYRIAGTNPWASALPPLIAAAGAAYVEELVMRGIILRNLEALLGSWISLASTALLFGAAHLGNPNASILSALAIALEAGVLLGAAYMLTRRLWLAMGVHFAWNFVQSGVFGVAVSGVAFRGILRGELHGPVPFTGGRFGVEASVPAVIICLGAAAALLMIAARLGNVIAPAWRVASGATEAQRSAAPSVNQASTAGGAGNP